MSLSFTQVLVELQQAAHSCVIVLVGTEEVSRTLLTKISHGQFAHYTDPLRARNSLQNAEIVVLEHACALPLLEQSETLSHIPCVILIHEPLESKRVSMYLKKRIICMEKPLGVKQFVQTLHACTQAILRTKALDSILSEIEGTLVYLSDLHHKAHLTQKLQALRALLQPTSIAQHPHPKETTPLPAPSSTTRALTPEEIARLRTSYEPLSARSFFESYDTVDSGPLEENLFMMEEKLALAMLNGINASSLPRVAEIIAAYGQLIGTLPECDSVAFAITHVSNTLRDPLQPSEYALATQLLIGFSNNLKRWREDIFETRVSENIHFLSAALVSDALVIESLLFGRSIDLEEDYSSVEFF